jgi:hypothetical protein
MILFSREGRPIVSHRFPPSTGAPRTNTMRGGKGTFRTDSILTSPES